MIMVKVGPFFGYASSFWLLFQIKDFEPVTPKSYRSLNLPITMLWLHHKEEVTSVSNHGIALTPFYLSLYIYISFYLGFC